LGVFTQGASSICFLTSQKAIKDRNIDLSDIEANIIGTDREKQPPPEK